MNKPKSASNKIAFTGTNCSGKTTMAMEVCARLKHSHVLAELVSSQDRKITWKDEHFPVDPRAHYGMICNLINAEVQAELKGDCDVVITDRSVLDLYAIALTDHPISRLILDMKPMVLAWASTYTTIYRLEPLPYQEDGKRPSDDFRLRTYSTLVNFLSEHNLPNVVYEPREAIYDSIKKTLNVAPNPPLAEAEKWGAIVKQMGIDLLVKAPKYPTSDVDVWILEDDPKIHQLPSTKKSLRAGVLYYFGEEYCRRLDILVSARPVALPEDGNIYTIYEGRADS